MSVDPKKFGITPSLLETVKEALKGDQHKLDVAEPKGKLTSADFKKLRGEGAKPDFLDLDKDGNKKEPMKHAAKQAKEEVEQTNEAAWRGGYEKSKTLSGKEINVKKMPAGHYWSANNSKVVKMHEPGTRVKTKHGIGVVKSAHSSMNWDDDNNSHYKVNVNGKTHEIHADDLIGKKMAPRRINIKEVADGNTKNFKANMKEGPDQKDATNPKQGSSVDPKQRSIGEAAAVGAPPASMGIANQMADRKQEIQRKIAQKQAMHQQSKAKKRIAGTMKEGDKCSCGNTNESKMNCEVHGGKHDDKNTKGGKEQIVVNPPLKEASDLPKPVVKKGHEIAKSLIKHRAKVKSPYAVGMAAAKKSAGIKD